MRYALVTRAAYGALLLLVPGVMMRMVSGESAAGVPSAVARILGFRHLTQALLLERNGTRKWLLAGTAIDAAHALSMVGLAALNRGLAGRRRSMWCLATRLAVSGSREAHNA